ncbi:hypothetical protein BDV10DRAFT_180044 [Aspergillus recurvatus]
MYEEIVPGQDESSEEEGSKSNDGGNSNDSGDGVLIQPFQLSCPQPTGPTEDKPTSREMPQGTTSMNPGSASPSATKSPHQRAAALPASQSGRTENGPWKLVATSTSTLKRPAVASPIIEPQEQRQVSAGIEPTPKTATANNEPQTRVSQESAPTSQTRNPPRTNPSESSPFGTRTTSPSAQLQDSPLAPLPAQDTPGNGTTSAPPKPPSLADGFQIEVNRYAMGFAEKIKGLETRLDQSLADNASLERRLHESLEFRHEVDQALAGEVTRNAHLLRRVEELTEDMRKMEEDKKKMEEDMKKMEEDKKKMEEDNKKMEEELQEVEGFRDAVRRLENTRVLDVLKGWASTSNSGQG